MKIIIDLISLCIGIAIYHLMTGQLISDAYPLMYWCCFGGGYMAVKYKAWKAN